MSTRKKYANENDQLCDLLFNPPPLATDVEKEQPGSLSLWTFGTGVLIGLTYNVIINGVAWLVGSTG